MIVQDQMLSAVYWHPRVRAVFAMFHAFLAGLVGNQPDRLKGIVEELKSQATDYDALHKVFGQQLKTQPRSGTAERGGKGELEPLIQLLLEPSFGDIYRPVAKYAVRDRVEPRTGSPRNVFGTIVSEPGSTATSTPIDWNMVRRLRASFRKSFEERGAALGRFDILVDVPWGKNQSRSLTVIDADTRSEKPIAELWHLAPTIFERPTAFSSPIRVFVSPKLYRQKAWEMGSIREAALEKYFDRGEVKDDAGFV